VANEIKFGNKVVFLNGNPILLPQAGSDPGSAVTGDMYYKTGSNRVRYYDGSTWQNVAYGDVITDHGALSGLSDDDHTQYPMLVGRAGGQTLIGGTAASNNLVLQSTSNSTKGYVSISETTAATAYTDGALVVAGGVGIAGSVYSNASVYAATSVITPSLERATSGTLAVGGANTTQLDLGVNAVTTVGNILTGSGNRTVNIGTGAGTNVINIGGSSSTVNVTGTLQYVQTTNLQVTDKLITINKGGAAASGDTSGFEVEEDSAITAYIKVGNSRTAWDFKSPASSGVLRINTPDAAFTNEFVFTTPTAARTYTFKNASGTLAFTSDLSAYLPLAGGTMTGDILMSNQTLVKLGDTGSNYVALKAPTTVTSNYTLTYPAAAPSASQVLQSDGSGNFSWVANGSGTVNAGVAGRLSLYPTSAAAVDDVYTQNSQSIEIAIAAQATRSAGIVYTVPNPGDAETAASFILDIGAQTISGQKTFGSSLLASANNNNDLGSDSAEFKDAWVHSIKHNDATNPNLNVQTTGNNGKVIVTAHGTGSFDMVAAKNRMSTDGTNFFEEMYFDSLTLAAGTVAATEIDAGLSFASATYTGAVIDYVMKEASTGKTRVGHFTVSSDGSIASSADQFSETAALGSALGLSLDATWTAGSVVIRFNNTHATNASTLRANVRKFRA